jgi:hypothetical protein
MQLIAPTRFEGGNATFVVAAREREPDFDETSNQKSMTSPIYRTFLVTSTANDGSGSLRQAIRDLDAACTTDPCLIAFHIEEPSSTPWKTIHITSPLPFLSAGNYFIDGSWQTETVGDTNPGGPEIEISGGGMANGDGLLIGAGCHGEVASLAINGFRGNGVSVIDTSYPCKGNICLAQSKVTSDTVIHHLFLGTDPTGSVARANGLRGVGTSFGLGPHASIVPAVLIDNSVISGNTRSGIFVDTGTVTITGNRIGLKAHSNDPLPNGASGIYFGAGEVLYYSEASATAISSNDIAFNRDFGIAINPKSLTSFSKNRIWANGNLAIDNGLDGKQTAIDTGSYGGPMPAPWIMSAQYDALSNKTVVKGMVWIPRSAGAYAYSTVELFASNTAGTHGMGDAQTYIGSADTIPFPPDVSTPQAYLFIIPVDGNHPGEWLTATVTRIEISNLAKPIRFISSELSTPVQVTR